MRRINLVGERFGKLVVVSQYSMKPEHDRRRRTYCECRCDCGNTFHAAQSNIRSGKTASCGCYFLERVTKHGYCKHHLHSIWRGMIARCHNPRAKAFAQYGGRGIFVCDRWRQDFEAFIADMGSRPSSLYSIDRIDTNGPYTPENCRWADDMTQMSNRRNTTIVTIDNETKTLRDWLRILGISENTYRSRLRIGLTPEQALTHPLQRGKRLNLHQPSP